jgi:hypothetical protein
MKLLCDKIIIARIPVDVAPIRAYIRKYHRNPTDYISELRDTLLKTANFTGDATEFERGLDSILLFVTGIKFISVKDSINKLEKVADWTRRTA